MFWNTRMAKDALLPRLFSMFQRGLGCEIE